MKSSVTLGIPIGGIIEWPSNTPPPNFMLVNGALLSALDYPDLFNVIGTSFGGTYPNFNLPDARGGVIVGADNIGGTSANRIAQFHLHPNTLGSLGGLENVQIIEATLPPHGNRTVYSNSPDLTHSHSVATTYTMNGNNTLPWAWDLSGYSTLGGANLGDENESMSDYLTHNHPDSSVTYSGSSLEHNNMMPSLVENPVMRVL
jgi:microcystin-dependent protein